MLADALFLASFVLILDAARRVTAPYGGTMTLALVLAAFVVYLSMVVPGLLGIFHPAAVTGCYAVLAASLLRIGWTTPAAPAAERTRLTPLGALAMLPVAAGAAVLALYPIAQWLALTPDGAPLSLAGSLRLWVREMTGAVPVTLNWDVVSYHLPGLMEYLQNGTLWSFQGPYQSYSYGFELITGFSVMHGGILSVLAGNMLGLAVTVAAGASMVRSIGVQAPARRLGPVYEALLTLAFAGMAMIAIGGSLGQLGKNDVFTAACLLASLALLLRALTTAAAGGSVPVQIAGSAAALALAIATKPNTLAYLLAWVVTAGVAVWKHPLDRRGRRLLAVAAGAALLAGMAFSLRNLAAFGSLTGDLSFSAWGKTVAAGIASGLFWEILKPVDYRMMALLGCAIVTLGGLAAVLRGPSRLAAAVALAWLVYGLAIFSITPFSLFFRSLVQWRMAEFSTLTGMVGFTALLDALLGGAVLRLAGRLGPLTRTVPAAANGPAALGHRWRREAAAAAAIVAVIAVTVLHHRHGEPRPQQTIPRAHAGIYDWIAAQPEPLRIYAAGLRPYGLFGPGLKHRLFYDLNTYPLYDDDYAQKRINRVRRDFAPDIVIIAVDPLLPAPSREKERSASLEKPLVPWLAQQPCLTEIFSAPDLSAFRVERGCTAPWGDGSEQAEPLRMGT
ncbi:hypothetical protein M2352_001975 [Azospirillum fermentarium]|uniref:hypothetical protein n=1 Tax=Azospirillum fermentarium TaxID=1233114 RepID=UPI002226ED49|nr:hypothetical protein [Azospirillum fermentarium]MCW2246384.1 hypothetical protein [Azospirillum fermentarium]